MNFTRSLDDLIIPAWHTMNQAKVIAGAILTIGIANASTAAGPVLLDAPGPGYRQQSELVFPKEKRDVPPTINFGWSTFDAPKSRSFPLTEELQPFSEPIRLHIDMTIGRSKSGSGELSAPTSARKH